MLFDMYAERFGPLDDVETGLIEEMVASYWRLRRAFAMEARLLEVSADERADRLVVLDHQCDSAQGRTALTATTNLPACSMVATSPRRRRRSGTRRPSSVTIVARLIANLTRLPSSSRMARRGG